MRRPNGTGTIVNLGSNRRRPYAIKISYQERPGLWKQKYLSYHRTSREAQDALDEYNRGTGPAPDKLSTTLRQVYDTWSERKYKKAGKASIASYKASWCRLGELADKKMKDITLDDLQRIIDQDERDSLSKSSLSNDKTLMKALFKFAMERDIIMKDYSLFVELPTVETKHEKGAFTDFQIKQLEQMAADGFPWADTALILCYTGFRITEFLTLTRFSYHADGEYLQGGLKTRAGKDRIVPVHPKVKPYLDRWMSRGGDTIFCAENGGPITSQWYRTTAFPPIAQALGVPSATPHWCRHTFASRLHTAGADELAIKRLMGHSNKDVTEHYTHTDIVFLRTEIKKLA